jgi:glycosyltransferase involved in cell wall biosynthesis
MNKVVIISAAPSPYRIDFFNYLIDNYDEYSITIIYTTKNNRSWKIEDDDLRNTIILRSILIKYKVKYDKRIVSISYGITKILKDINPDIVIGSEYNITVQKALSWAKIHKIKFISWTDGTIVTERNMSKWRLAIRKIIIKNANTYLASSTKSKELQINYGAKATKIFISYLTVDIEKYSIEHCDKYTNTIICVGSLIKRKGVDLLLNALSCVEEEYTLHIVGDGIEKTNLKKLAVNLGIDYKVKFHGYLQQKELSILYSKSSIFILPSREDCYGLVTLEAMCASLPVISSKFADSAYDLIDQERNGFIIDPYNKEEFGKTITALLKAPDVMYKMGQASKIMTQKFHFAYTSLEFIRAINSNY